MGSHIARNAGIATALVLLAGTGLIQAHDAPVANPPQADHGTPIAPALDAPQVVLAGDEAGMACVEVDPPAVHPDECI